MVILLRFFFFFSVWFHWWIFGFVYFSLFLLFNHPGILLAKCACGNNFVFVGWLVLLKKKKKEILEMLLFRIVLDERHGFRFVSSNSFSLDRWQCVTICSCCTVSACLSGAILVQQYLLFLFGLT